MIKRTVLSLTTLLLLCAAAQVQGQMRIEGIGDDDLAMLTASIVEADTLHLDLTLRARWP